jgi:DNA-binding response OmpR family regulator
VSAMKKSAWVVDDDEDHIRTLQIMFNTLGYDCTIYTDPAEIAENISNGYTPDLLLIDTHLPENTAYELITFIRENEMREDLPIITLEDQYSEESEYAIQIGADEQLSFPLTLEELETAVSNAYERRVLEDLIEEEEEEF